MKQYDAARLIRLFDSRYAALGNWRNRWAELAYFILPSMVSGFNAKYTPGTKLGERVFDSTALEANDRLSNRLHEALTNPATAWFHLAFKQQDLNDNDAAREWLDDCEQRMSAALADSNFDMIMGQFYLDIGAFGSAGIDAEEKPAEYAAEYDNDEFRGFLFRSLHLGAIALAECADGVVDQVFFKFDMTAEQWRQRYPESEYGERLPQQIAEACQQHNYDKVFPALVCRFRRAMDTRPEGPLLPKERPFAEVWVSYDTKDIVEDGGTYEQAAFIGRWRKKSDDIMGYGPGERALPTIKTVNQAEFLELGAWAKQIDPPIKTTMNNIIGQPHLESKGVTVVRDMDEAQTWDLRPDLNHHMIQIEDKRFQIRDIFKYHSLELPPREQVGEMTAFEVAKRVEQIYRSLGPTVVQLQADVLNGLVNRLFGIMYRKKAFAPLPAGVVESKLSVDYVGPMALAAKATELDGVDRFVGDAMALAQSGQEEAMDIVDLDKLQRYKAKLLGVPALVTRSVAEIKALRDARNTAKERAADEASNLAASEAMKNIGAAVGQERMDQAISRMGPRGVANG